MAKLTINNLNLKGKRVFTRVDYNVPMEETGGTMVINDDTRIRATLPTLRLLTEKGARIILAAHLGRPKGERVASMSLRPVANKLAELIGQPVAFVDDCVGEAASSAVNNLQDGEILLLENVRYHACEEANKPDFAEQLAANADVFVNDAFGAAHRAHASTAGIAEVITARGGQCAAGLLMERELKFLGEELKTPDKPFVVILGGAKVSDKIKVIDRLIEKADTILIGGAMAYTFKLALGKSVGDSLVEPDKVDIAQAALDKAAARGVEFLLPTDNLISQMNDGKWADPEVNSSEDIPDGREGVDIGPATAARYAEAITGAKTILWNGPMGIFEDARFAKGTMAVAVAVAGATGAGAVSIIGGGDSVKALNQNGLAEQVTFMSTGGGASLEFLEGNELPGVAALSEQ
ncbi:MAG: phosphoglycerate kinase [Verrucomicrobia subdivision 3 bacterium]|nr:phosphoglycerate kinase [Limisphaerales bacterium]